MHRSKLIKILFLFNTLFFVFLYFLIFLHASTKIKFKLSDIVSETYDVIQGLEDNIATINCSETIRNVVGKINRIANLIEKNVVKAIKQRKESAVAILVPVCDRVTVKRCLETLLRYRPSEKFPIIVSQGCLSKSTSEVVRSFGDKVIFVQQPIKDFIIPHVPKRFEGYYKIAQHYKKALDQVFFDIGFDYVIVVEDDLEISVDFFEYFLGTLPILQADPSLLCVSAWNDNGKPNLIEMNRPELLHRTDFFPGLGWMLSKKIWSEMTVKWPIGFWDDWIRHSPQRKGRSCIRPEISRTKHFGRVGVSGTDFHKKHLRDIYLNEVFVPFTKLNLSYLLKPDYDTRLIQTVFSCKTISLTEFRRSNSFQTGIERTLFCDEGSFPYVCSLVGLMNDFNEHVPRTSYEGIVTFFAKNARIYVVVTREVRHSSKLIWKSIKQPKQIKNKTKIRSSRIAKKTSLNRHM